MRKNTNTTLILSVLLAISLTIQSQNNIITKDYLNQQKKTDNPSSVEKQEKLNRLISYLKGNWVSPEKYIIDKFRNHDIIFLSEDHGVKHNLILAQTMIPLLYKAGIYNFGMEFGASEDQTRLDSLVTAPKYDENIARKIMFNYNVGWAIKEYIDIYRTAWNLNATLSPAAKKFRIINLSYKFNWSSCDKKNLGIKTPETVRHIFHKGGTEEYRAKIVKELIVDKNEKILILTGGLHAFTKYQQAEYDYYAENFYHLLDRSFGNLVYKMVPNKTFTILLHYPFESKTKANSLRPAQGLIDDVMQNFQDKRVGFDLTNTPLGDLRDTSFFSIGHDNFKLSDMADGYIYQNSFPDYQGCTFDDKFFSNQEWSEILKQYPDQDIRLKPRNLAQYKAQIKNFLNIKARYKKIK